MKIIMQYFWVILYSLGDIILLYKILHNEVNIEVNIKKFI